MKVLLTGANGFIGIWTLRRLLDKGHSVRAFDLVGPPVLAQRLGVDPTDAMVTWLQGDISDACSVARAMRDCDAVVHLAGVLTPFCQADPVRGAVINLCGTLNVFESARTQGIRRVVYASSAGVYGPAHHDHPEPTTHYGAFKLACEGSARAMWCDVGISSVGLRPFVVYGPGRDVGASAGISLACEAAVQDRAYAVPFTGRAGMVHVDDVIEVIFSALEKSYEGAHLVNLVGEVGDVQDVLDEIRRQAPGARLTAKGRSLQLSPEIKAGATHPVFSNLPTTPIAAGIKRTLDVYRSWQA